MTDALVHDALASHTTDYEVHRLRHEVRPHATYEVTFEGERAACKVATHPAARPAVEAHVLDALGDTAVPVPRVLAAGPDHVVTAWCEEVPDDDVVVDEARIRAMGRGLATLHAETAPLYDRPGLFHADADGEVTHAAAESWPDALRTWLADRRAFLGTVGFAGVADEAIAVLDADPARFAVDDAVLVHGNYLPEHVGVGRGGSARQAGAGSTGERGVPPVTTVIDVEHCLVGSPELDYLRAVLPLFGGATDHGVEEAVFRDAYESVRPLPPGFEDRRRALTAFNGVSYLRALHLQRGDRDGVQTVARRARRIAGHVRATLADVRRDVAP